MAGGNNKWANDFVQELESIVHNERQLKEKFSSIVPLTDYNSPKHTHADMKKNISKNRDPAIVTFDQTRVLAKADGVGHVKKLTDKNTIYINASHIERTDKMAGYVASQGPTKKTVNDHWLMIWRLEIKLVIMLTKCGDGEDDNCCVQYWPRKVKEKRKYNTVEVNFIEEIKNENYIERTFELTKRRKKENRTVKHIQFTEWPSKYDRTSLNAFHSFFKFARAIIQRCGIAQNPVLVHCSDGGFRTGVLILLNILIGKFPNVTVDEVSNTMIAMRKCRKNIFSDIDNLRMIYKYLIHYIKYSITTPFLKVPSRSAEQLEKANYSRSSDADNSFSDASSN